MQLYEQSFLPEISLWYRKRPEKRTKAATVLIQETASDADAAAQAAQLLRSEYGRAAIAAYVQVALAVAAEVIAHDDVIDAAFRRIGSEIAQYIAARPTEAETALDLFMVTKYLERLGDHAVNVAEWVEFLKTGIHKSRKIV